MFRYSVILGNLGNTRDRFCGAYKTSHSTFDMLRQAAAVPHVEGIELVGTWDVDTDSAADMKRLLGDVGKECVSIIPDLFTQPKYARGSYSSPDATTRRESVDYTLAMCEVAQTLGCRLLNIWPGQDGFDYMLASDIERQRDWFRDAIVEIADAFPAIRLALEYKPKEPRCFSLVARMADSLLMVDEIGRANVGVCIDTGHAYVAGESVGEAVCLAARRPGGYTDTAGRLYHMHFNDNHGLWDDDLIAGTVHLTTYLETFYWLKRAGYDSWISMDQYPFREPAAAAIGESIIWLRHYESLVEQHYDRITATLQPNDAVATSRLLRAMLGIPG